MDEKDAKKIIDTVFKDVFGSANPFTVEEFKQKFAYDLPLPVQSKSSISNKSTWGVFEKGDMIANQEEMIELTKNGTLTKQKKDIKSMEQLLDLWKDLNFATGDRTLESKEVLQSDGVYNSAGVFNSRMIVSSQNQVFCYNNINSKYLIASRDNAACNMGIRFDQSIYCSSSYEVRWSTKVSRSIFINSCSDMYECMFCSQLVSKKYCIANMQFEKEEYFKLKEMVIKWILKDIKSK